MSKIRSIIICTLLLAHMLVSAAAGGSVLCIHADGNAFVESPEQLIECHTLSAEATSGTISDLPCRDIAMVSDMQGTQFASARACFNHLFQLSPTLLGASDSDRLLPAASRNFSLSVDSSLPPDGVLSSLATIILTV